MHKPELVPLLSPCQSTEHLDHNPRDPKPLPNLHPSSHARASRLAQKTTAGVWAQHCHVHFSDEETEAQGNYNSPFWSHSTAEAGDKGSATGLPVATRGHAGGRLRALRTQPCSSPPCTAGDGHDKPLSKILVFGRKGL